jgi:hypothetical protein
MIASQFMKKKISRNMKFEVLVAVTVFCDTVLHSWVEVYLCFRCTYCCHLQGRSVSQAAIIALYLPGSFFNPEDGSSMFLWNIGSLPPDDTA